MKLRESALSLIFLSYVTIIFCCEEDQIKYGCRIHDRECLCGVGCDIRYRYKTRELCLAALRGRARDTCNKAPCKHGGLCIQTSDDPGFVCHCAGTGYYGHRCEQKCPNYSQISRNGLPDSFPVECIVI